MAIITATIYQEWAEVTVTGAALTALSRLCTQVDAAIKDRLKRVIDQTTFTDLLFPAPWTPHITLARFAPITITGFECQLNLQSYGDPDDFDGDTTLLTMYEDYTLDTYPTDSSLSPGLLTKIGGVWSNNYYRPPMRLGLQKVKAPGAVMLSFQGGYAAIPADLQLAACLAISVLTNSRKFGGQVGSESWNGYNYSLPSASIAQVLNRPNIAGLLDPFMNYVDMIG